LDDLNKQLESTKNAAAKKRIQEEIKKLKKKAEIELKKLKNVEKTAEIRRLEEKIRQSNSKAVSPSKPNTKLENMNLELKTLQEVDPFE
jgi:hypothetical protein